MAIDIDEIPSFYHPYFDPNTEESVVELLIKSRADFESLLGNYSDQQAEFKYAKDKWSIKDLIQHLVDSERIFVYRALRFARNDKTELSGFEQNDYASIVNADTRGIEDLIEEFLSLRDSTISMFSAFQKHELERTGVASGFDFSVESIGYMISGHLIHHLKIIRERYV